MKALGYLLLSAGFIAAAYATALDVDNVGWPLFAVAALAALAGVILIKRHARSIAQSEEVLETNRAELRESIDNVVRDLREIVSSGSLRGATLRDRIDAKLRPDLTRFADARESMVHLFETFERTGFRGGVSWYRNFEHFPWEDASEHLQRSPLMYAGNVTTT